VAEKAILSALAGVASARPPFWFMRQAGRYLPEYRRIRRRAKGFLDLCLRPELAAEASLQPVRRFRVDAAILFSDILVVPYALGQKVRFVENSGPTLDPVRGVRGFAALKVAPLPARLAPVYEAVSAIRERLPAGVALIGFAGAPWTVALYMVEGGAPGAAGAARAWAWRRPDDFDRLVELLVEATALHLVRQVESGAEALQLFDTWAGLLSESEFRRWVIRPTAEIVRRLKSRFPKIPVIGFPKGAGALFRDYAAETGVDGVGVDSLLPLDWAAEVLQPRCAVQGNLDNQLLRCGGPALDAEVLRILGKLSPRPFIFNLGHGILPDTPPKHVARVAELVRGWPRASGR
jgi:uroporphyrinogen decarboxylase